MRHSFGSTAKEQAWRLYRTLPAQMQLLGRNFWYGVHSLPRPVPVTLLRGTTARRLHPLSMIVAGPEQRVRYLPSLIFDAPPAQEPLKQVPLAALPRYLEQLADSADVVIALVDPLSARLLFGSAYLRIPEWVDLWLELPEDPRISHPVRHREHVKSDLRRVRRNNLICEISHSPADLAEFHRDYHLPFVTGRFGEHAVCFALPVLRRHAESGGLIWVSQAGQRIAGAVFERQGTFLKLLVMGTHHGDYDPVKRGSFAAIFRFLIELAHDTGCEEVNYGGCRPLLTDGSLRFKEKWGCRLVQRQKSDLMLIRWMDGNAAGLIQLARSAPIFPERGHLSALYGLDDDGLHSQQQVNEAHRRLWTPALRTLYLLSDCGFQANVEAPAGTSLVDMQALPSAGLAALLASGQLVTALARQGQTRNGAAWASRTRDATP